ncbi:MAG: hypothetical protein RLZZ126_457 [Pseudomonadota bacterium]
MASNGSALFWFRRDLRLNDHAALHAALSRHDQVFCVFVFDVDILQPMLRRNGGASRQVAFMHACLHDLAEVLRLKGSQLLFIHGRPTEEIPRLVDRLQVSCVYAARDYEPQAIARDLQVMRQLNAARREFFLVKDQVVFDRDEVLTQSGTPFGVFTPYKNAWLKKLLPSHLEDFGTSSLWQHLAPPVESDGMPVLQQLPTLAELGFGAAAALAMKLPIGPDGAQSLLDDFGPRMKVYKAARDFPAVKGPSYLSAHLRFGTVSIRHLVRSAQADPSEGSQTWLSELIWREFYQMILWHHPHVVGHCYKPALDALRWDDAPHLLAAWCEGRTGYPLVDAAMRQLNQTGYMHNRLRMVTASFLTKDLGVDWRLGEAYFADQLIDFDLAANNGGWQWAASTGCDAQPWFRIFNPITQSEKFDPKGQFIRRYVPELVDVPDAHIHAPWLMPHLPRNYPAPVVDHATARQTTLARFDAIRASD